MVRVKLTEITWLHRNNMATQKYHSTCQRRLLPTDTPRHTRAVDSCPSERVTAETGQPVSHDSIKLQSARKLPPNFRKQSRCSVS